MQPVLPKMDWRTGYFWHAEQGRNRHFFLRGQSHFSWFFPGVKCFFPVQNSHFGTPKTNFCLQKWKEKKKKKKKKRSSPLFISFPTSISNFPPSCFTIFLLFFSISTPFPFFSIFSLPLFSRYVSKNFPVRSLGEGHSAPCSPACYAGPVTPRTLNLLVKSSFAKTKSNLIVLTISYVLGQHTSSNQNDVFNPTCFDQTHDRNLWMRYYW